MRKLANLPSHSIVNQMYKCICFLHSLPLPPEKVYLHLRTPNKNSSWLLGIDIVYSNSCDYGVLYFGKGGFDVDPKCLLPKRHRRRLPPRSMHLNSSIHGLQNQTNTSTIKSENIGS